MGGPRGPRGGGGVMVNVINILLIFKLIVKTRTKAAFQEPSGCLGDGERRRVVTGVV